MLGKAPPRLPFLLMFAACAAPGNAPAPGTWHAWLDSPGGALPFGLELSADGGALRASVVNGIETTAVPRVELEDGRLRLAFDPYDASVTATLADGGRRLDGVWERTGTGGTTNRLDFHAVAGAHPRFGDSDGDLVGLDGIDGRWSVEFSDSDDPAVGVFETRSDGTVLGTFLTTTGDYRYLAGRFAGGRLRLSCFDGAHAFLFDARLDPAGRLTGDFWSRDTWHETWTARPSPDASLPDAFALTHWTGADALDEVTFPDADGRPRSLGDPEFAGRARILVLFGSWCPNCNDAMPYLVELYREYRDRGLSVVGLAFEMTGDFERDAAQVRRYAEYHGIEFPLLVAGLADKAQASEAFPLLDRVRAYPTTIFLHADGRARAVHQGYAGPATGEANRALRRRFRELIEELLAEPTA